MKKTIKKLALKTETIKQLDDVQLGQVAGGITGSMCVGCSGAVCPTYTQTVAYSNCVTCTGSICQCVQTQWC